MPISQRARIAAQTNKSFYFYSLFFTLKQIFFPRSFLYPHLDFCGQKLYRDILIEHDGRGGCKNG